MREFNLDEAKKGAHVCTETGRPVRILCFDRKNTVFPIVGLIYDSSSGKEIIRCWDEDGYTSIKCQEKDELRMVDTEDNKVDAFSDEFIDKLAEKIVNKMPQQPKWVWSENGWYIDKVHPLNTPPFHITCKPDPNAQYTSTTT